MNEKNPYLEYRTSFIVDVLKDYGKTDFDSVVDFGCGDGRLFCALVDQLGANRGVGVDYRAPVGESKPPVEFVQTNFFEYSPSQSFDLVTSIQVFEHIYEPWLEKYFDAIKRCCNSNGTILISTPNRWRPSNIVRVMTFRKPWMMNANPGVPAEEHLGHHRESSYRELAEILGRFFPADQWRVQIARPAPRRIGSAGSIGSTARLALNLSVYYLLWWAWRPLCVSSSHDHYAVIQRL